MRPSGLRFNGQRRFFLRARAKQVFTAVPYRTSTHCFFIRMAEKGIRGGAGFPFFPSLQRKRSFQIIIDATTCCFTYLRPRVRFSLFGRGEKMDGSPDRRFFQSLSVIFLNGAGIGGWRTKKHLRGREFGCAVSVGYFCLSEAERPLGSSHAL